MTALLSALGSGLSANKILGSSDKNALQKRDVHDFYSTPTIATTLLLKNETFDKNIWEPACGLGHISKILEAHHHIVKSTDLINRDYGQDGVDFLQSIELWDGDIITNPPNKFAEEFVQKAINVVTEDHKVAMFLKVQFLEGKKRKELFQKYPPKIIYVSSQRLNCPLNGIGSELGGACCYAWFIWQKNYQGDTVLKWI